MSILEASIQNHPADQSERRKGPIKAAQLWLRNLLNNISGRSDVPVDGARQALQTIGQTTPQESSGLVSELPTSARYKQRVLPERLGHSIQAVREHISPKLADALREYTWVSAEIHDVADIPIINVLRSSTDKRADEILNSVIARVRRIKDLLGYSAADLRPLTIILDPTDIRYKNATAICQYVENDIWIKSHQEGFGFLDHELGHWATAGQMESPHNNLMLEGMAAWIAWQVKTPVERAVPAGLEYHPEDFHMINRRVWANYSRSKDHHIDDGYDSLSAMSIGAELVQVIYEKLGSDPRRLGEIWRNFGNYGSVSEWLSANGLSPIEIEAKWKQSIFGDN